MKDFDSLCALARSDPRAFFERRNQLIEDFIRANPTHETLLRQTQAQIDAMRASAGGPLQALRGLSGMMGDHLEALGGHLAQLRSELKAVAQAVPPARPAG
ncbi:MAG: DUF3135 domain-containing protein [Burkholderiales bacterium]|nr:DUF3135 domain-containing protein [Burkholderiales bacterium]